MSTCCKWCLMRTPLYPSNAGGEPLCSLGYKTFYKIPAMLRQNLRSWQCTLMC